MSTIVGILGSLLAIFATWYGGKLIVFVLNKWNEFTSEKKVKNSEQQIADYINKQKAINKTTTDIIRNIEDDANKQ